MHVAEARELAVHLHACLLVLSSTMTSNTSTLRDSDLYSHQEDKCRKTKDLSKTFAQNQDYQQENNTTDSKHNELIKSLLTP